MSLFLKKETLVFCPGAAFPPLIAPLVKSTEIGKYSHDGQKDRTQVLVRRRSEKPIRNFRPWGAQNG